MSQEFNSSFIPKKEVQAKKFRQHNPGANIFLLIGVIIFLTSLLASLAVWLWSAQLDTSNARALQTLERNRENYAIETIQEFIDLDKRLRAANLVLEKHTNMTKLFQLLEESTLEDNYLANFSFGVEGGKVMVKARGHAPTYAHVALQAEEYSGNKLIENLVLSDVNQGREGDIEFDVAFEVDRQVFQ